MLERKDVRFKVNQDLHSALVVLADVDQVEIGEWVEQLVQREVVKRIHEANVVAERLKRLGISGSGGE